jgi:hypothetical protein
MYMVYCSVAVSLFSFFFERVDALNPARLQAAISPA